MSYFQAPRSSKILVLYWLFWVCSILLLSLGLSAAPVGEKRNKLRANDPAVASEILQGGGELIADYGSFQLFAVDDKTAAHITGGEKAEDLSHHNKIELNAGVLDTTRDEVKALRKSVAAGNSKSLHLVQFAGPIKPEWWNELEQTGVKIICYIPQNTYLIFGKGSDLARMQAWAAKSAFVQWEGTYHPDYKIHPRARTVDAKGQAIMPETDLFSVQLVSDSELNPATLAVIDGLKLAPVQKQTESLGYVNVGVRLPADRLPELAGQPDVVSIQPRFEPHKCDERQDQIIAGNLTGTIPSAPGYLSWLGSKGFTQAQFAASGFAVDVSDSGIDNGTTSPGHFGLYLSGDSSQSSRVIYNRLVGTPNSGSTLQGCDGHGNLNTHIIAGYNDQANGFPHTDSSGYHYGLGVCPFVKVGSSVIFDTDSFTSPNYTTLQSQAYHDGARVSANSWGADTAGAYNSDSQTYDALVRDAQPTGSTFPTSGNQQMVIVFAAGNAGSSAQTVGAPGTAKNVITVGASENVLSMSTANGGNNAAGNDGCSTPDSAANSADDIATFSSRGPCSDGRHKPEIVAPGTHITGGVGQTSPPPSPGGTGSALSCFKGSGVCALPGGGTVGSLSNFFPINQQFYSVSSGTSHSTPAVAGSCALIRQYFINAGSNPPSPAMTKAFLMNSARYLTGSGANDSLWSNNQGMGEVNLGTAFDGTVRSLHDQIFIEKFTATGQTRTYNGTVNDPGKPFRVTLAWTDAPGNTTGNAYNNDLDLVVTVGGNTYKGNVFSGASSITGGTADSKDNAESVFLPAGVSGTFTVTVTAANITSDGVPNESPALDQDFALVIYNGAETAVPVIVPGATTLSAESCTPTNNAVDAGETVTVNFTLSNAGSSDTTNVVATLLATNGVTAPSGAQNYGALLAGGAPASRPFTFTANGSCGSTISPTFHLQDGATDLGTVTFNLQLGVVSAVLSQNFDGVSAPALPAGWTTTTSGSQALWVTSASSSDTAPNAAFSTDASAVGVNELVSPSISIPASGAQLSFRHSYGFESGFDGGVLEIKISGGSFTDIVAAGGSFASGPYTATLSTSYSNPLGGRSAWSGSSGGFIPTLVNLPAAAAGQSVQFKWRAGSDSSISGSGWYVDTVTVLVRVCCGQVIAPTASFSASPTNGAVPLSVNVVDASSGTITNRFWNFGNGFTTNTAATNFTVIYNSVGTNTVTLTVTGPGGTNTLSLPNYVIVTNPISVMVTNGLSIVTEACTNGAIDPGETVTLNFGIKNSGAAATSNLVATLLSGGGIVNPSAAQTYGAVAGGSTVSQPFTFTATGACGSTVSATLQLQDGASNFGTLVYNFVLGQANPLNQNFDSVSPPALPAGWTATASGGETAWVTTSATNNTAPNSVFAPDPASVGESILTSPVFALSANSTQMMFRHNYNTETGNGTTGYDGGVVEVKIGAGAFTDIVTAGGSFVSGGYNKTISSSFSNPLAGRQAWSGNSGGFTSAVVNLPAAALGQNVQFRWRMGSDASISAVGWYVDSIVVGAFTCCSNAPSITLQPQSVQRLPGQDAAFSVMAKGTAPLTYQWQFNGTNLPSATASVYSLTNVQPIDAGPYDAIVSNPIGSATSSVATLTMITPPVLMTPFIPSNGYLNFTLSGNTGLAFAVETTTNLFDWETVAIVTNDSGQVIFTTTNAPDDPFRAYRARLLP